MTRILGIDPGSRITGYGVVDMARGRAAHVADGCIRTPEGDMAGRLRVIFEEVQTIIERYEPAEMAIEKVFVNRNVDSALKLGQARGVAIVAAASRGLPVFEFSPTQIKQAIVGRGGADKVQIQHMVRMLLNLEERAQSDAADALAAAICHGHTRHGLAQLKAAAAGTRFGKLP